jgi:FAD/FMN-containing dehydrogenase
LRRRHFLWSVLVGIGSLLLLAAQKVFDYAAPPDRDKESNFTFPADSHQEKVLVSSPVPRSPSIPFRQRGGFSDDASHLNKTPVYGIVRVTTEDDLRRSLEFARENDLKVSCAGQQHSMGGQTLTRGGLVVDLSGFNRIGLDKENKVAHVGTGVRWWQLQQFLDQQQLSVKAMQSINIFSIGGTLSVNAHGIDPAPGPVASTVRSIRVMLSSGDEVTASAGENGELFRHALGGYGLFGVILDADLKVVENEMYARKTVYMDYTNFPQFYTANVDHDSDVGLFFGRLSVAPQSFLRETMAHIYSRVPYGTPLPALEPDRHEALARFTINFSKTGGVGRWFRWNMEKYAEPYLHACVTRNEAMSQPPDCLVSRNGEMYDDMAYLKNRLPDTDILQEYFIPYRCMPEFVDGLREVVLRNGANLLNVTIRTVHKDTITALPYAKKDMFAFVLYFNVRFNERENQILQKTTSELIDMAQKAGGTYYLPYQLFYSRAQLSRSYPEIDEFFLTKKKYDPAGLFSNKFYEKYGA